MKSGDRPPSSGSHGNQTVVAPDLMGRVEDDGQGGQASNSSSGMPRKESELEKLRCENLLLREDVQRLQAQLQSCTCGPSNDDKSPLDVIRPPLLRRHSSFELGDVETIHCEVLTYLSCADLVSAGLVCHRWLVLSASAHVWKQLLVRRFLHSSALIEAMSLMNFADSSAWMDVSEEKMSSLSTQEQATMRVGLARQLRVSGMIGLPPFPQTREGVSTVATEHGVPFKNLLPALKKPSRGWRHLYQQHNDKLIVVEPRTLLFDELFDQSSPSYVDKHWSQVVAPIVVTNVSESYSALFKIKTTAPSFYTVKPAHGIVTPGGFVSISIKQTRGQPWPSPDLLDKCRDKFLVQVMILTEDLKDMPLNDLLHLSDQSQYMKVKMRCRFGPHPATQRAKEKAEASNDLSNPESHPFHNESASRLQSSTSSSIDTVQPLDADEDETEPSVGDGQGEQAQQSPNLPSDAVRAPKDTQKTKSAKSKEGDQTHFFYRSNLPKETRHKLANSRSASLFANDLALENRELSDGASVYSILNEGLPTKRSIDSCRVS